MSGSALLRYDAARTALAAAHRVDEVKDIRDKAHALAAYARQANDTAMVEWATEIKVRAERRAGELLAAMRERGELGAGRPPDDNGSILEPLGIDKKQSSRWQKLAAVSDAKFEAAVDAAKAVAREVTATSVLQHANMAVHYSSETDRWATPQALFNLLNREFSFVTDVCASLGNAKCSEFYTAETDGLAQRWVGTCWMNPPYGDEIGAWIAKAHHSGERGATVVCLVPARVDTGWWWDHCRYGEIRFIRGRLRFGGADAGAPFPSALVVFGPNVSACVKWWEAWPTA